VERVWDWETPRVRRRDMAGFGGVGWGRGHGEAIVAVVMGEFVDECKQYASEVERIGKSRF
jgi:hypothetical protein